MYTETGKGCSNKSVNVTFEPMIDDNDFDKGFYQLNTLFIMACFYVSLKAILMHL